MIASYKLTTLLSDKNRFIRKALEGKPVYVIEKGCILIKNFKDEDFTKDELFAALRLEGIKHLGEVSVAIRETTGELSVFPFKSADKQAGLPILPNALKTATKSIKQPGSYACCVCGNVQKLTAADNPICSNCENDQWVKAEH